MLVVADAAPASVVCHSDVHVVLVVEVNWAVQSSPSERTPTCQTSHLPETTN